MAIHAGFEYSRQLQFRTSPGGAAVDVSAWDVRFKITPQADATKAITLASGAGIEPGADVGSLILTISQADTADLPAGPATVEAWRLDGARKIFLFAGRIGVK